MRVQWRVQEDEMKPGGLHGKEGLASLQGGAVQIQIIIDNAS